MSDVRKALESARSDACRWMQCSDECLKSPDCTKASRAAVMAFLRAMPDEVTVYIPHDPQYASQLSYVVPNVASRLTDAIEKEAP